MNRATSNSEQDNEQRQQLVRYLYGDLEPQELLQFEQQLETNASLRDLLEQEQQLQMSFPVGTQPQITDSRLQGNQWLLQKKLLKSARPRFSIIRFFHDLLQKPAVLIVQLSAMAATFALGLMVAQQSNLAGDSENLLTAASSPLEFINEEDYEIYQLQINNYDAVNGEIDFSFSLASKTQLSGNVADPGISGLMATSLQNDIDSAARIAAIEVLQPVAAQTQVVDAMMYLLRNDRNPGVRYQAVELLVQLADEERVRESLRQALSDDVNPGVRLEAFNALVNYVDEDTLNTFRQRMYTDSNSYIREQSQYLVEIAELDAPI